MLNSKIPKMAAIAPSRAPRISDETYQAILKFTEAGEEPLTIAQIAEGIDVEVSVIRRAMAKLYRHPDYTFLKINENSNSLARYSCFKRAKSGDIISMLFRGNAESSTAAVLKHKKLSNHH